MDLDDIPVGRVLTRRESDPSFNTSGQKFRSSASSGSAYEFTSQLFFDDALTDQVPTQQPYASKGQRDLHSKTPDLAAPVTFSGHQSFPHAGARG
jgi:hypothetical protein